MTRARKWKMWCVICDGVGPIFPTFSDTKEDAKFRFEFRGSKLSELPLYRIGKVEVREIVRRKHGK